jgi:protein kinase A
MQTLGKGSLGRVRLAKEKSSGAFYAVKLMKKNELIRLKQVDHVRSEISILASISHPFMVDMLGSAQDTRYIYLFLEFVSGGELFTYLRTMMRFELHQARFYAAQVVLMFEYLHSKDIIYRDLKPENIIIASDGYLKLTDFGFAKVLTGRTYTLCGTPEYLCPEIILNKGHGKPVDWWTLGVLLYELVAGIDPFSDEDPMMIYQNILKNKVRFPKTFDTGARSLVKHLLVEDLSKRYGNLKNGVNDIKLHRLFAGLDWTLLLNKLVTAPFKPRVKSVQDTSNFNTYPDSSAVPMAVSRSADPFINF